METKPNLLPSCSGYESWTVCGYEFDCDSIHTRDCEHCLCNYHKTGGRWHPETGKQLSKKRALKLYGKPMNEEEELRS
jgi:hypothetical protein